MAALIKNKSQCCGCTACKNICPTSAIMFETDQTGFEYPNVDEKLCINCGLCRKVCDFNKAINNTVTQPNIYAAKIKDDDIRKRSSSGGLFSAVSDLFLKDNGVVYGAAHDKELVTVHIRATNKQERDRCMGSKYVQSLLNNSFALVKNDLSEGRKVFFTGTPCQVAGLLSFLKCSGVSTELLYTADLICHGVPSPIIFQDFLRFCEKKTGKKVAEHLHRPKDAYGWSHNEKIIYKDGSYDNSSQLSSIWKKLFYSNTILRPSCLACKYANPVRYGDITLADFWGIERVLSDFADSNGVSLVFVNTLKGRSLFKDALDKIICKESSLEACRHYQANLNHPSECKYDRDLFWKLYEEKGFEGVAKVYGGYGLVAGMKKAAIFVLRKTHLLQTVKRIIRR